MVQQIEIEAKKQFANNKPENTLTIIQELHKGLPSLTGTEGENPPCAYIDLEAIVCNNIINSQTGLHIREIGIRQDGNFTLQRSSVERRIEQSGVYIPDNAFFLAWNKEANSNEDGKSLESLLSSVISKDRRLRHLFFYFANELYQVKPTSVVYTSLV